MTSQIELRSVELYHLAADIHLLLISKTQFLSCCKDFVFKVLKQDSSVRFSFSVEVNSDGTLAVNGNRVRANLSKSYGKYFFNQSLNCVRCSSKTFIRSCFKSTSFDITNCCKRYKESLQVFIFLLHCSKFFWRLKPSLRISECVYCFPAERDSTHSVFQRDRTGRLILQKMSESLNISAHSCYYYYYYYYHYYHHHHHHHHHPSSTR